MDVTTNAISGLGAVGKLPHHQPAAGTDNSDYGQYNSEVPISAIVREQRYGRNDQRDLQKNFAEIETIGAPAGLVALRFELLGFALNVALLLAILVDLLVEVLANLLGAVGFGVLQCGEN